MPAVRLVCAVVGVGEGQGTGSRNIPISLKQLLFSKTQTLSSNPAFQMLVFFNEGFETVHAVIESITRTVVLHLTIGMHSEKQVK